MSYLNAIEFCAQYYARPILEKEKPEFDGDDLFAVATVFESTLPYTKTNKSTGEVEKCHFTHNNFFGYLIVQPDGYWARNRNGSGLKQKGSQSNLLPSWAGFYQDFDKMQDKALYDFVMRWNEMPALIIEMGKTQFQFQSWQLTYDLRHVVINTPKENFALDFAYLKTLTQGDNT